MNNLLIPPVHAFPVFRLLMWFALGSLAFREGYEDAQSWNTPERKHNLIQGRFRWLGIGILMTESILCWKYRENTGHINEDAVTPFYIWFPWTAFYVGIALYWVYLRFKPGHTIKYPLDASDKKKAKKIKDN
mmetsp:Transcript_25136/g.38952  ORF Transcript_25136/g.38952 Transcript_25136/m.38952 type:complete len:132 (-) Transcript_25136:73-468(-)